MVLADGTVSAPLRRASPYPVGATVGNIMATTITAHMPTNADAPSPMVPAREPMPGAWRTMYSQASVIAASSAKPDTAISYLGSGQRARVV